MSPDGAILDLAHLEEIRAMPGRHGPSLLPEFVALFMREEPGRMAQLRQLAAAGDMTELHRLAHTLAGSCAILGAIDMQRAALKLQAAAKANAPAELPARLEGLDAAWKRLKAALAENKLL